MQTVQVLGMHRCIYVALEAVHPAVFGSQVSEVALEGGR